MTATLIPTDSSAATHVRGALTTRVVVICWRTYATDLLSCCADCLRNLRSEIVRGDGPYSAPRSNASMKPARLRGIAMKYRALLTISALLITGAGTTVFAQGTPSTPVADARPDTDTMAEQYLLLGSPTRICGESQVAVSPVNPNQIAVAAMCVLPAVQFAG